MDEQKLMEAVVELRTRMKLTQVKFATEILNMSVSTLQRYEKQQAPPQPELVRLFHIARTHGHHDLAAIFKGGAIDAIPVAVRDLIREPEHAAPPTEMHGHQAKLYALVIKILKSGDEEIIRKTEETLRVLSGVSGLPSAKGRRPKAG